jgi:hypothetical protein
MSEGELESGAATADEESRRQYRFLFPSFELPRQIRWIHMPHLMRIEPAGQLVQFLAQVRRHMLGALQ